MPSNTLAIQYAESLSGSIASDLKPAPLEKAKKKEPSKISRSNGLNDVKSMISSLAQTVDALQNELVETNERMERLSHVPNLHLNLPKQDYETPLRKDPEKYDL